MRQFGLIGYPLSHSFSQGFFSKKFENEGISDCEYNNYPIDTIQKLPALIKDNPDIVGINVTIPYKQQVQQFLHELDASAEEIGAVNTIKIDRKKNILIGYNTDCYGFSESLNPYLEPHHKNALILGTGGAAKAVEYAFKQMGIAFQYVSRTPRQEIIGYNDLTESLMQKHTVIVNTSPLGMYPDTGSYPAIPYEHVTDRHVLYDLVYNPEETEFIKRGKTKGAVCKNGLEMLHLQALKAWEIWNS
jgi:shikimate dehydrogenase